MKIKKLLFATQFKKLWFDALQSLLVLRKAGLEHVVLLNVIERDKVAMHRGAGYQKNEEIKLREKANIRFIDWAENLFERGMEVGVYIVVGLFAQQVVKAVEKEKVDLIVIGHSPKKTKLSKLYSGSHILEILKRSSLPILVYKCMSQESQARVNPFESILFPTNWSLEEKSVLEYIKGLKDTVKKIDVIHVADENSLKSSSAMQVQKVRKESKKKLDEICHTLDGCGINAKSHVYVGDTIKEIEKAARECQSTMIILGSSGKGMLREKIDGSISKELAEKSIFPTLLVPAKGS